MLKAEPFDERPAALLAQELRFEFFRGMLTTSFSIIGGVVALKGLLVPDAPLTRPFLVGVWMIAVGGFVAFEGQTRIIDNLTRRRASNTIWTRLAFVSGPTSMGLGV
ncbi:MAG: hypothetical protein AAGH38_10345, partial [Pseudomonadota bacterium]